MLLGGGDSLLLSLELCVELLKDFGNVFHLTFLRVGSNLCVCAI